jgi:hypothetical protein
MDVLSHEARRRQLNGMAVFAQYGRTMLAVQMFELFLATLALCARVKDPHRRVRNPWRQARTVFKRTFHTYRVASASEMSQHLEGKIDPAAMEPIDKAIKWRNQLAHRYLREHMIDSSTAMFKPGTLAELERLATGFDQLAHRLREEHERLTADWPKDATPPEVRKALEVMGRSIILGEPLPPPDRDTADSAGGAPAAGAVSG